MADPVDLGSLVFSPTAWLFEGGEHGATSTTIFVTRTPPGRVVNLHVHPYTETFLLLEGRGRWTAGETVVDLVPEQLLVVPPETLHGFRNTGDVPLLVISVHESGALEQTFTDLEPA
jgi:mannose-6-phosphate isomerase-like protein (cupin superfamily)